LQASQAAAQHAVEAAVLPAMPDQPLQAAAPPGEQKHIATRVLAAGGCCSIKMQDLGLA